MHNQKGPSGKPMEYINAGAVRSFFFSSQTQRDPLSQPTRPLGKGNMVPVSMFGKRESRKVLTKPPGLLSGCVELNFR